MRQASRPRLLATVLLLPRERRGYDEDTRIMSFTTSMNETIGE